MLKLIKDREYIINNFSKKLDSDCTTFTGSYGCSGDGKDYCYYGRYSSGDYGCGWFEECWCSDTNNCDGCSLEPSACTSPSGCTPTKIATADCRTGSCSSPDYPCVYFKRDSGGSGIGSCVVGTKLVGGKD